MTARHLLVALGLAAAGCQSPPTSRPGPSSVVDVGAASARQESASPRSRHCRVDTIHGEGPAPTRTTTEVFVVEGPGAPTELRLIAARTSIVVQREYDATKRLVSESHRTKEDGAERHVTTVWRRGRGGRVESADSIVEERSAGGTSRRRLLVTFPERDALGHWVRTEARNEGDPVTRADTREYDSAGRLAVERSRWAATPERPAKSAESRFTYEGSSRTPAYAEQTTTDAAGQVTERTFRRFDASGRLRSELVRPTAGPEASREAKYDDAGRIVEELSSVEVPRRSSYRGDCPSGLHELFEVTGADAGED